MFLFNYLFKQTKRKRWTDSLCAHPRQVGVNLDLPRLKNSVGAWIVLMATPLAAGKPKRSIKERRACWRGSLPGFLSTWHVYHSISQGSPENCSLSPWETSSLNSSSRRVPLQNVEKVYFHLRLQLWIHPWLRKLLLLQGLQIDLSSSGWSVYPRASGESCLKWSHLLLICLAEGCGVEGGMCVKLRGKHVLVHSWPEAQHPWLLYFPRRLHYQRYHFPYRKLQFSRVERQWRHGWRSKYF